MISRTSTSMMSSVMTSSEMASLFGKFARFLESRMRHGILATDLLEKDDLKELGNDLWTVYDTYVDEA